MDKGISIIISCCDNYKYVLENIESILNINIINDYEIIVIDDSINKKSNIFYNYQDKIKVIENKINMGVQYARNIGLKNAKYKYILMIDGDDKLNNDQNILNNGNYIDLSIDLLENNKDIAFTQCIINMFDKFDGYTISSYKVTEELLVKKHHVPICIIYRREEGLNCGGYDLSINKWQDWSFAISLLNYRIKNKLNNETYFFEKPYYLYRIHNPNKQISNIEIDELSMIKQTIINNKDIFIKYYKDIDVDSMSKKVLDNKPDRTEELMFVAHNNINIAKEIIKQRKYILDSPLKIDNIP